MTKVSEIMSRGVASLESKETATTASQKMTEGGFGCLLVTRKGRVVGIVTERDLVRKVLAKNVNPEKIKLEEIMSQPVITVGPSLDVGDASKLMSEKRIRRLPVMESDMLVGIVTTTDIARYLAKTKNHLDPLINAMARQEPGEGPYK
jgi:CBS domain-containing protein